MLFQTPSQFTSTSSVLLAAHLRNTVTVTVGAQCIFQRHKNTTTTKYYVTGDSTDIVFKHILVGQLSTFQKPIQI